MGHPASEDVLRELEHLHPKRIDLSLDRITALLAALGHPERAVPPVIHIAGTNGKGSTAAFMKAILEAAGYRVQTFTSPHLRRFHEQIRLAGGEIPDRTLSDVLWRAHTAGRDTCATMFELTTAAAFLAFAADSADVLILESGMGGRLDATNVIARPALTVITPISIDHTAYLGGTVEDIAVQKAGILKPGVPCVSAHQEDAALAAIAVRAASLGAPLFAAGAEWDVYQQHGRLIYQEHSELADLPLPRLAGAHQVENAGTAIAAVRRLEGFEVSEQDLARGLTGAVWRGRMERLGSGVLHTLTPAGSEIWIDGGHNPAAGEVLARAIADLEDRVPRPLHLITGMMRTKDAAGFLRYFKGLTEFVATVAIPGQADAYTAEELAAVARGAGLFAEPAESVAEAFALCRGLARGPVRVLAAGSLYLAGHLLDMHEEGQAVV